MRTLGAATLLAFTLLARAAHADDEQARGAPATARHEPSAADLATARTALREGLQLREERNLQEALARLATAFDLVPTPVTGFELGKTHMMLGHVLQAHELFRKVGRMPPAVEESERSATARTESARLATELGPRIPTVRLKLSLVPGATATVRLDDEEVQTTGAVTPRAVDPGKHVIVAKAGDGPEQRVTLSIAEGEAKDIELAPTWVKPKEPVRPQGFIYVPRTNPLVFVGFGGASVSLIVATLATSLAVANTSAAKDVCGESYCPQNAVTDSVRPAKVYAGIAVGAWASTVAFLAVGIISISNPVKDKIPTNARLRLGPTGAALEGQF